MAVILKRGKPAYQWPVVYRQPADGGKYVALAFTVTFRRKPQEELDALAVSLRDRKLTVHEFLAAVIDAWDLESEHGAMSLEQLLDEPGMGRTLLDAWNDSLTGAFEKN